MSIKPELCCDADLSKMQFPIMGLPKYDGVRLMHIIGSATGRSLKPHGNLYTTTRFSDAKYLGLDGEATFGDVQGDSLCRDTTSVMSRIKGEPEVVWNIFDWLHPDVLHLGYFERYTAAESYVKENLSSDVKMIPYTIIRDAEHAEQFYQQCLEEGFEGAVYRGMTSKHKDGRATVKEGSYLRLKASSDKEAICLRLAEAMENLNEAKVGLLGRTERSSHKENKVGKGMVGMLVCKDVETGMEIDVGAGKLTHEERTHYWNNPHEIVGKFIKYRSMDSGVKEKPRFARMISIRAESDMS